MSPELERKLYDDFPALYSNHTLPMTETSMCFGFQCGDGWYDLINRLSFDIAKIIATDEKLDPKLYTASCVKEKFGSLRFYMNYSTDEIGKEIGKARYESEKTCELCGGEGKMQTDGWIRIICEPCELERNRQREEERRRLARRDSGRMDVD